MSQTWRQRINRLAESRLYDKLMRLPGAVYCLFILFHELDSARHFVASQIDLRDPVFLVSMVARSTILVFFTTLLVFFIVRRPAMLGLPGLWPQLVAVVGTLLTLSLPLLDRPAPSPLWDVASAVLILAGNYLSVTVVFALGRSFSILPQARQLVTDGAYRWVRHPLYVTEEIVVLGVFLQFRSLEAAIVLIVHFACQLTRMFYEERVLAEAFPEYETYKRQTARLIPGIL